MSSILIAAGSAEIEVKKSRFIADAAIVHSAEDVSAFISGIKKKHYAAKHHCSAYILDTNPPIMHSSDDGEPQGTAGRPILSVLEGHDLRDVCICVTRYFGGTLLGTGGLSRAYREAAALSMENSEIRQRLLGADAHVESEYTDYGRLEHFFADRGFHIKDTQYGERVSVELIVPEPDIGGFEKKIADITGGKGKVIFSDVHEIMI